MFSFLSRLHAKKLLLFGGVVVCLGIWNFGAQVQAVNGLCGIADGGHYSIGNFPPGGNNDLLCDFGNPSAVTQNPTTWDWTCGDNAVSCSANISPAPNNGQCGSANAGFYSNGPPSTELCANDPASYNGGNPNPTSPSLSGGVYEWDCEGTNNPIATSTSDEYVHNPGTCFSGSDADYPNCDECEEGTSYPNCRIHPKCRAIYVAPTCGTANGVGTYAAPEFVPSVTQTNLCNPGDHTSDGETSTVSYNAVLDQYEWQCRGDGITDTANCSAPRRYDGVCGVADGGLYGSEPPDSEKCDLSIGNPTGYSFNGTTYSWQCQGKNGGANTACSATHVIDGACGANDGGSFRTLGDIFTGDNCTDGTSTAITENTDTFTWTCNSDFGGSSDSCSANKIKDGDCGISDGGTFSSSPPDQCEPLTDAGLTAGINLTESGDLYTWNCEGIHGGGNANCSANIQRNGQCGPEHGGTFRNSSDIFPGDQCDVGTETAITVGGPNGLEYSWGCTGVNGGGGVGCGANVIKDAVCDPVSQGQNLYNPPISGDRCVITAYNSNIYESAVTINGDQYEWTCDGPFGGLDASCSANIRVDGVCGSSAGGSFRNPPGPNGPGDTDLCAAGIDPVVIGNDTFEYSWICAGEYGGLDANCTANVTRDGQCDPSSAGQHINGNPSPDLCINGTTPDRVLADYDPGTFTYTWGCEGINGGNTIPCQAFESTDAICGSAIDEVFYKFDSEGSPSMESILNADLCAPGTPINLSDNDGPDSNDVSDDFFEWTCDGPYSGADEDCQAQRKYNGECGVADSSGIVYANPPDTADLCNIGNPSLLVRNGLTYEWTCAGVNGGVVSGTCDADHDGSIGSIQSGIDRANSFMGVNYTAPAGGGAATFRCFGQNNPSFQAFFDQAPLNIVNLDETPPELLITDCLKQVGEYEFELYIIDHAGNESPQNGLYYIDVLPGDIDPNNSDLLDCGDQLNFDPNDDTNLNTFPSLVANGIDACELKLMLKDSQGNEVTTIPPDEITMNSPTPDEFIPEPIGNDSDENPWGDANVGVSFREGLRIDNHINPTTNAMLRLARPTDTPNIVPDRDGDRSNGLDFNITAVAPSMIKLGNFAGAVTPLTLALDFTVPDIDDFGQIDYGADPVSISKSTPLFFYPMIRLQPNLMTYIDHLGNEQYAVFADSPIPVDLDFSENNNDDGGGDRLVPLTNINGWLYTTLPESDTDPNANSIDFDDVDLNIQQVDTDGDGTTDATRYGLGIGVPNQTLNQYAGISGQANEGNISALLIEEDPNSGIFENQYFTSSSGYAGQEVNLVTNVSYNLPDPAGGSVFVSYPGGFVGSPASLGFDPDLLPGSSLIIGNDTLFYFRFVGASIEGGVIGSIERLSLSGTDLQDFEETYTTVLATGLSANEAREAMRAQAFEVINGVNPQTCGGGEIDFQSLLDSNAWDTEDVVYVQGCDVKISEDIVGDPGTLTADELKRYSPTSASLATLMPDGQKTLVIQDGNLFIENDLWYNDWIKDSFGFIVFNENIERYPQTGNVFVLNSVKRIVGTYYVEGGVFGNQGVSIDYNIFDPEEPDEELDAYDYTESLATNQDYPDVIANTVGGEGSNTASATPGAEIEAFLQAQVEDYNRNQLILHGTLLSYNTLGGYHIWHSKIPIDGAPENYFTAWNVMDNSNPDETNEAVAIQYDLHYLRRFNVHDWGTGIVCDNVVPSLGVCFKDDDGSLTTDYVEDLDGPDNVDNITGLPPADGIPDGDGYADYTKGGFDSARCTPDLQDILLENTPIRCDQNPNAFVIRNDQKVTSFPPPGFGVIGNMDLTQGQ